METFHMVVGVTVNVMERNRLTELLIQIEKEK